MASSPANSNKAQLRELEQIRSGLLGRRGEASLSRTQSPPPPKPSSIRTFFLAARFIARARISARAWARQEAIRHKLQAAADDQRRRRRSAFFKVVRAVDDSPK